MNTNQNRAVAIALRAGLVVLAAGAAWWFTRTPAPAAAPSGHNHAAMATAENGGGPVALDDEEQRRIGVTFAPVESGDLGHKVRVVAQVTWDETRVTAISPRIEGWVDRLLVDFTGRTVRAGEPLMAVYSPMVVTTVQEIGIARRLAGEVSEGSSDARTQAEGLVHSGHQRLAAWGISAADIDRLEQGGDVRTVLLRSPVNGVVVEKNVVAGQRIMPGDALYRIADLSTVWLEGEVFEQDLASAKVGLQVTAEFQALPGVERTGRITYVYPMLNPETRTGKIRVSLANPGLQLKPGMFATIRFTTPAQAVLSVPRSAVLSTGARNLVFLKRADGRFTPTDVVLGRQSEERIEILRGLSAGDTVVASATFLLDAESNLGTLMGGMGDMPGMDMTAPGGAGQGSAPATNPAPAAKAPGKATTKAKPDTGMGDMPGMDMPGMDMSKPDSSQHQHQHQE